MPNSTLKIAYKKTAELTAHPRNARTHSARQLAQIARSIERFGFTNPVLVDEDGVLIAGHGRLAAAEQLGLETVPSITVRHLSDRDKRALMIADNKIALNASWDLEILASEIEVLSDPSIDFDVTITGFETAEIDLLLDAKPDEPDGDDEWDEPTDNEQAVSRPGDLWQLGDHRLLCGDALDETSYQRLLGDERVRQVITDPPYNVPIAGHVSGLGKVRHREFAMAAGEMDRAGFTDFLETVFGHLAAFSVDGAIVMVFMDWRHVGEVMAAGEARFEAFKNLVVWDKGTGGMGTLYRSQHELVFVFKSGTAPHVNTVELGRHGRYRTNVWAYRGANSFGRGRDEDLATHPTVKPVGLIADAIRDCSNHNELVLDPFAGSGTILLAAERSGRQARAMELDPLYVDAAIRRWQARTGKTAMLSDTGETFEAVAADRLAVETEDSQEGLEDDIPAGSPEDNPGDLPDDNPADLEAAS